MTLFSGKFAVVTGGTRGIGKAIVQKLASEGATVFALFARDRKSAELLEKEAAEHGWKVTCVRGDLTDDVKFKEVVGAIQGATDRIDFLVHSAASGVHRPAMELSLKHLDWTFQINVFAIHNLIRECAGLMPSGSRIIGVTSSGGTRVIPYYTAVGSSKGAVESLFRHYAFELAPRGISVNMVCPGMVLTDAVNAFPDRDNRIEAATKSTPTGRLTTPGDVAELVTFLCLPAAAQIVGQTLVMDGGKTLLS